MKIPLPHGKRMQKRRITMHSLNKADGTINAKKRATYKHEVGGSDGIG